MNIYIFEAQGLKNISIKLGILVYVLFENIPHKEKKLKIFILFMPF